MVYNGISPKLKINLKKQGRLHLTTDNGERESKFMKFDFQVQCSSLSCKVDFRPEDRLGREPLLPPEPINGGTVPSGHLSGRGPV